MRDGKFLIMLLSLQILEPLNQCPPPPARPPLTPPTPTLSPPPTPTPPPPQSHTLSAPTPTSHPTPTLTPHTPILPPLPSPPQPYTFLPLPLPTPTSTPPPTPPYPNNTHSLLSHSQPTLCSVLTYLKSSFQIEILADYRQTFDNNKRPAVVSIVFAI